MAAVAADEIDEAHLEVLQIAADFVQFFDVILEMLDNEVELGLNGGLILVLGGFKGGLQKGDVLVCLDDVGNDPANKRQRTICLGEFESLGGARRRHGFWGCETRTSHRQRPPFSPRRLTSPAGSCGGHQPKSHWRGASAMRDLSDYDRSWAGVNL